MSGFYMKALLRGVFIRVAIEREKQIKACRREKKVALIESLNSKWRDLSLDWHSDERSHNSNKRFALIPTLGETRGRLCLRSRCGSLGMIK